MIEVIAYNKLQKTSESEATQALDNAIYIEPASPESRRYLGSLEQGSHYLAESNYHFNCSATSDFSDWQRYLSLHLYKLEPEHIWLLSTTPVASVIIDLTDINLILGSAICAELYAELAKHLESAMHLEFKSEAVDSKWCLEEPVTFDSSWYLVNYRNWLRALKLASDGGCIEFL